MSSASSSASTGFCNSCRDHCSNLSPAGTCRECRQICATCLQDYAYDLRMDSMNEYRVCPTCHEERERQAAADKAEHEAELAAELADGFDPTRTVEDWFNANPTGNTHSCIHNLFNLFPTKHTCLYDAAVARARKRTVS